MRKVLIIDWQVVHTLAMQRGIGKYSHEFLSQLLTVNKSKKTWDAIHIIVSSRLNILPDDDRALKHFAKEAQIVRLPLERDLIYDTAKVTDANRRLIDDYVSKFTANSEVDFLILAALQGGICTVFPGISGVKKSVVCYDLIPFMFHNVYYANPIGRSENLSKLNELLKADSFLTISKTVANDIAINLGVDPARIFNIDGGPIDHAMKNRALKINGKFILMPTGNDLRKNNLNAIKGFKEFNTHSKDKYSLVITSFFTDYEIKEFKKICPDLIFTGNIDGEELKYLYQNCEMVLFPSFYEGLGLPVLEAVERFKPVACSDIPVFREISTKAFNFFDYSEPASIAKAIEPTLSKKIDKAEYINILGKYDWKRTVELAVSALAKTLSSKPSTKATIYTVNPENRGMAAKVVQRSYAELSRRLDLYYLEDLLPGSKDNIAPNLFAYMDSASVLLPQSPIEPLLPPIIYDLANDAQYARVLFAALANPGIVLLHDTDLSLVWEAMLNEKLISKSRYDFEQKLQANLRYSGSSMLSSLVAHQKVIVVFDEDNKRQVNKVKKTLNKNTAVELVDYPVGHLVYRDIMPTTKPRIIEVDTNDTIYTNVNKSLKDNKKRTIRYNNSFEYEKELSSASYVVIDEPIYQNLEAFKYGAIPISLKSELHKQYSNILAPSIIQNCSKLLAEGRSVPFDELKKYAKIVQDQLAKNNNYRLFAQKLSDIVTKVSEE